MVETVSGRRQHGPALELAGNAATGGARRSAPAHSGMEAVRGWLTIARFGLVQAAIGAMTVLPITTVPRLMQNEIGLAATAAGVLVGIYYATQVSRLKFGAASDFARRRVPFILAGLVILGLSSVGAAFAVRLMAADVTAGYAAAALAFVGIGIGVGAAGTPLLALLAVRVAPHRKAAAGTIVWLMMIFGLGLTAALGGRAMSPFSYEALITTAMVIAIAAVLLGTVAVLGLEGPGQPRHGPASSPRTPRIGGTFAALREIWREPQTRGFAIFVFVSMFAYNMQEVVTETFLGTIFGLDAGQATSISGNQKFGALAGVIAAAVLGGALKSAPRALVALTISGCVLSALALIALGVSSFVGPGWPVGATVALFGLGNGIFAGGAVGSMVILAGIGRGEREGTRMGAFGFAQGIGFGLGLFAGAMQLDLVRRATDEPTAFASVFFIESLLFLIAAALAVHLSRVPQLPVGNTLPRPA